MKTHDPFTGAKLTRADAVPGDPRLGVPENKFGALSVPILQSDRRHAVMMMLFPPEELRDQPLDVIRQAVHGSANALLENIALEIYRSFTSDPLDAAGARNVVEALQSHVDAMSRGGR